MASKKDRKIIHDKYNGRCAYCGDPLRKGWHVDELLPVRRNNKWDTKKRQWVWDGTYKHPERFNIDNQMPSCPSCNINKHSMSLETFRASIQGFMKHLNEVNTQYKIAKRYGLVRETDLSVIFYFETFKEECEHDEIFRQGDEFTYSTGSKCGKPLI